MELHPNDKIIIKKEAPSVMIEGAFDIIGYDRYFLIYLYNKIIRFPTFSINPSSFNNFNSLIIALLSTLK